MFICVICHFTRVMWPVELVFQINISITGRSVSKSTNKCFSLICFTTSSCVFRESMACQLVALLIYACIQNTIYLSIILVLTFRVSKPIKFSLHFTNNNVPELTKRPSFEVRKKNVDLVFIYREVYSRQ